MANLKDKIAAAAACKESLAVKEVKVRYILYFTFSFYIRIFPYFFPLFLIITVCSTLSVYPCIQVAVFHFRCLTYTWAARTQSTNTNSLSSLT